MFLYMHSDGKVCIPSVYLDLLSILNHEFVHRRHVMIPMLIDVLSKKLWHDLSHQLQIGMCDVLYEIL